MTTAVLVTCRHCGIVNDAAGHLCLLCGVRLDRPVDFSDKAENLAYFARGGAVDIALAVLGGDVIEDESDGTYSAMLDTALKLGLESSWATMDLVFYRRNPVHGVPTMGVRWPANPLLTGLELSFMVGGRENLYAAMERPGAGVRGTNYRWDQDFSDPRFEYQLTLYGEIRRGRSRPRYVKTDPVTLVPDPSGAPDAPYSLVRPLSGIRVK